MYFYLGEIYIVRMRSLVSFHLVSVCVCFFDPNFSLPTPYQKIIQVNLQMKISELTRIGDASLVDGIQKTHFSPIASTAEQWIITNCCFSVFLAQYGERPTLANGT